GVRVEPLEHLEAHMPDVHSDPYRAEQGAPERGRANGIEVLAAPLAREPKPQVPFRGRARGERCGDSHAQGAPLHRVYDTAPQGVTPEDEHPLRRRLAVSEERTPRGSLVERHSHQPGATVAIRLVAVLGLQPTTAREEVGVHVPEIE